MNKLIQELKETMKYFFMITVLILVAATIYISVFYGAHAAVQIVFVWQLLVVSFLSSLSRLWFYTREKRPLGKKEFRIRWILCYSYVNAVTLGFGLWFGWFDVSNLPMVAGMLLCILGVFLTVGFVVYLLDSKTSQEINQKLQERNANRNEEE